MSTDVNVCNMALSRIGARATIVTLADATPEAARCAATYPMVKAQVLARHNWSWAPWPSGAGAYPNPDVSIWPPVAVAALVALLASALAFDITGNEQSSVNLLKIAEQQIEQAWAQDRQLTRQARVRDAILSRHDWSFARARLALTLSGMNVNGWTYAYVLPADCLVFRAIFNGLAWPSPPNVAFEASGGLVMCNAAAAIGIYTKQMPDPNTWPGRVSELYYRNIDALAALDVPETAALGARLRDDVEKSIERAWQTEEAQMRHDVRTSFLPDWIRERGGYHLGG